MRGSDYLFPMLLSAIISRSILGGSFGISSLVISGCLAWRGGSMLLGSALDLELSISASP